MRTTVNWVHKIFLNNRLDFFSIKLFFQINTKKSTSTHILAFQAQLYTVFNSLDKHRFFNDIFYKVIYVTLIFDRKWECILLL